MGVLIEKDNFMHVTERLRKLRERAGYSRAALGRALGFKGSSSFQRYEDSALFKRDWFDPDLVETLVVALVGRGDPPVTEDEVRSLGFDAVASATTRHSDSNKVNAIRDIPTFGTHPVNATILPRPENGQVALTRRIPVYGKAVGGADGEFVLNGNQIADVLAPASLDSVRDAYAVQVAGDSMEPRYEAGEIVYVNPNIAVRRGDYVVAQISADVEGDPPLAYIKRFERRNGDTLHLSQFNPEKVLTFPWSKVVSIHRIIMSGSV